MDPLLIRAELLCVREPFHWLFKVTDAIIDNFVERLRAIGHFCSLNNTFV